MYMLLWIAAVVAVLLALGRRAARRARPPEDRSELPGKPEARASAELAPLPDESWVVRVHQAPAASDPAPQGKQLQIELVPHSMHYRNVRAVVGRDVWPLVRSIAMKSDGGQCAECGSADRPECHEEWEYSQVPARVMKLKRLRILCHLCHMAKHVRFARRQGEYARVQAHVKAVYGVTETEFLNLENRAIERVRQLDDGGAYELDLTYMNDERFLWVWHRLGRRFGAAEFNHCIHLADDELVS